jgi:hypothetical protein
VLDVGVRAADRILVERDRNEAIGALFGLGVAGHRGLRRIATERACASRPFRLAQRYRRRTQGAQLVGTAFQDRGALHESSTPRPEEKRAERAVGSTWFEPPT